MTRGQAAKRLVQLLACDAIGDLVDAISDEGVRDGILTAMAKCRGIATDEESAAKLTPPTANR